MAFFQVCQPEEWPGSKIELMTGVAAFALDMSLEYTTGTWTQIGTSCYARESHWCMLNSVWCKRRHPVTVSTEDWLDDFSIIVHKFSSIASNNVLHFFNTGVHSQNLTLMDEIPSQIICAWFIIKGRIIMLYTTKSTFQSDNFLITIVHVLTWRAQEMRSTKSS
jgi:hypothetical protein